MLERNIDVSYHQGQIDWDAVIEDGVTCAIVKCIDGRCPDIDPRFYENWAAIVERRDRLVIGSYAFARPQSDGGGEADGRAEAEDYARTMLATNPPDDYIAMCDLERGGMDPEHSVQRNVDFLGAWVEVCERELGRTPWLYTGTNTWRALMGWTRAFTHMPLLDADYSSSPDEMPWPLTMLQYTSEGSVAGIAGNVDLSRFWGTVEDLREFARPVIRPRVQALHLRDLDLAGSGPYDADVARAQALMVALGQPKSGLIDPSTGTGDGLRGPATVKAWQNLSGSQSTVVDWRMLLP
jgi:lysozyme